MFLSFLYDYSQVTCLVVETVWSQYWRTVASVFALSLPPRLIFCSSSFLTLSSLLDTSRDDTHFVYRVCSCLSGLLALLPCFQPSHAPVSSLCGPSMPARLQTCEKYFLHFFVYSAWSIGNLSKYFNKGVLWSSLTALPKDIANYKLCGSHFL